LTESPETVTAVSGVEDGIAVLVAVGVLVLAAVGAAVFVAVGWLVAVPVAVAAAIAAAVGVLLGSASKFPSMSAGEPWVDVTRLAVISRRTDKLTIKIPR